MRRFLASATTALLLTAAPAAAFAINVSSNEGSGTQSVKRWYGCGAKMSGTLKSTSGRPVYYKGKTTYKLKLDGENKRYTRNTKSRTPVSRGGLIGYDGSCGSARNFTGVKVQVCRDRNNYFDPCGTQRQISR